LLSLSHFKSPVTLWELIYFSKINMLSETYVIAYLIISLFGIVFTLFFFSFIRYVSSVHLFHFILHHFCSWNYFYFNFFKRKLILSIRHLRLSFNTAKEVQMSVHFRFTKSWFFFFASGFRFLPVALSHVALVVFFETTIFRFVDQNLTKGILEPSLFVFRLKSYN